MTTKSEVIERNKRLIEEFPFLMPRSVLTDKVPEDFDYSYTDLDSMPDGWREAFGLDLCRDIKEELLKNNCLDKYRIYGIKEKYGELRWYDFGNTENGYKIIDKYIEMSRHTCVKCGKNEVEISIDWLGPLCNKCAMQLKLMFSYEVDDNE